MRLLSFRGACHVQRAVISTSSRITQCIKRRIRCMLGFKSQASAAIILSGIEMIHMMRKRQARYAYNASPSIAKQFDILAN